MKKAWKSLAGITLGCLCATWGMAREVTGWVQWANDNRPELPEDVRMQALDLPSRVAQKGFAPLSAATDIVERHIAMAIPDDAVWQQEYKSDKEEIVSCSFFPKGEERWSFAIYFQYDNPSAYYWTGTGISTPDGEINYAKATKFVEDRFAFSSQSRVCGRDEIFTDSDFELRNPLCPQFNVPFGRFWFFAIDDNPRANWEHECRYVFVKDDLSEFVVSYQKWWPQITRPGTGERIYLTFASKDDREVGLRDLEQVKKAIYSRARQMQEKAISYAGDISRSHFVLVSGGESPDSNGIRFWADTAMLYSTLTLHYKVPASQIHVLMSDGGASTLDANLASTGAGVTPIPVSSPTDLDGNGTDDIDGAATRANLKDLFSSLKQSLSASDQLFVFITTHGGTIGTSGKDNYNCRAWLYSDDGSEKFTDAELREWTKGIACPIAFALEICYSGGFIDDLTSDKNRIVATACNHYETSKGWPGVDQWYYQKGQTVAFDDWAMPFIAAFRGYMPKSAGAIYLGTFNSAGTLTSFNKNYFNAYPWEDGVAMDADSNKDGKVSMAEAHAFAKLKDLSANEEHPQIGESSSGLAQSFFLLKEKNDSVSLKTALDNSTLTFTTGGSASWFGQKTTTHDGVDAAQSGKIGNSQDSWMQTTVTGPGTVKFWWNTSCETNAANYYDYLEFLVDGTRKDRICGYGRNWVSASFSVSGSGQHVLKWNYHKDNSVSEESDCGWVDQVTWTPLVESKQTVKFNANGGKCGTATKIYTVGGSYSGFPVATKSGAVFLGWWTAKSGGVRVDDGDAVTSAATRPLYAHWTTKQSVMFNAMGGSCGTSTKSYTVAKTYGSLPKATWTGHAFLGWWTEQNGGTKVTASSKVPYLASRQLFAHWTTLQTVKFDANGGSCATASKGCTIGGPYLNLPTPTKSGRAFTGWFTEKSGGKKIVQGTTIATEAATRTFYAHWTKTQTAKFNANGGTCKTASKTYTIGSAYGSLPAAKKSGYGHAGWYTAASGGTLVEKTSKVTQEVTRQLYAQWTTIQTVKFDANGGSCATASKGCTIGSPYQNLPVATKSGVAFGGWWTAKTGGTKVVEGTTTVTESSKRTLYAHWTKTQTVKFNANGGTCTTASKKCTVGKTYGSLPSAKKSGYGHAGWYTAASGGTLVESTSKVTETAARTLYAHWTTLQMVQFDANGGSCGTPSKGCTIGGPYLNLPVPTKSGRAFTGWFTAKSGGKKIVEGTTTVTEAATRTLYAHWTKTQTVKFNANGGKCKTASKTYMVGTTYGSFPVASWTNHEFKGWATAASGGSLVAATSKVTAEMTRNLWARWSTAQTVTFDANGGTCATATKNYTMGGTYGSFPTATLDGFALEGWYTSRTAGTKVEVGALVPGTPTRTLYAHWTTKQIVTFDATGGTSPVKTKTFTVGGVYTNLPTPTWAGHAFLGWYSAKENGSLLPEGREVGVLAERTLYAYWTTKQTVTFDANGGTCGTSTKEYTIGQPYGSLPTATLDGFALQGWYTSKTGGTKVVKEDGVTAAEKRKLYARWTDKQVVTFDPRGGTCSVKTKTYTVGGTYTNLPVPTWSGHTFLGWYSEPTNGSRLPEGRKVGALAERTLYAYWSTGTKGLAFSGISVDAPSRVPAIRSANGAADSCNLRFAAPAGRLCRVQWTPSLDGEWTTLLEWTPESDGETDVPVKIPDTTGIGFFRLVIDQE